MPFAEDSISASVRLTVCRLYANPIVVLSNRPGVSLSETSGWRAGALALCAALIDNYWNVSWSCETTECVFKHYLRQARGEFPDLNIPETSRRHSLTFLYKNTEHTLCYVHCYWPDTAYNLILVILFDTSIPYTSSSLSYAYCSNFCRKSFLYLNFTFNTRFVKF